MQFRTVDRDNERNNLETVLPGADNQAGGYCGRANVNQTYNPQWDEWLYSASIISSNR